jgi:hypothetical protein
MIDKKMKGVYEWTALPTGVSARAAVGQAQPSGDKKKVAVDITQYPNLCMSLDNWLAVEANCRGLLEQLRQKEEAARQMLSLADAPADERRRAEGLHARYQEQSKRKSRTRPSPSSTPALNFYAMPGPGSCENRRSTSTDCYSAGCRSLLLSKGCAMSQN